MNNIFSSFKLYYYAFRRQIIMEFHNDTRLKPHKIIIELNTNVKIKFVEKQSDRIFHGR